MVAICEALPEKKNPKDMNQLATYGIQARQTQSSLLKSLNSSEALGRAQGLQELGVERAEVLFPSLPG